VFHRRRVRFDGPVFAVWGDRDRLVSPSHRSGVLTAFPKASIDVWAGMGHHPIRERFDDLLDLVKSALAAGRKKSGRRPRAVARRARAA
jgi:pimeloyl-ACP methyl ester carboxylesterase